jgi:anti-anti-sigma factor
MSTKFSQLAPVSTSVDSMGSSLNMPLDLTAMQISPWDENTDGSGTSLVPLGRRINAPCVVLVNLPEQVTAKQVRILVRDLREQLNVDQPCVVLDLSDVKEMDTAGLDLLLECLNETVRRDGTIQVRGISPEAATILELTGMDEILGWTPQAASDSSPEISMDYVQELHSSQHSLAA